MIVDAWGSAKGCRVVIIGEKSSIFWNSQNKQQKIDDVLDLRSNCHLLGIGDLWELARSKCQRKAPVVNTGILARKSGRKFGAGWGIRGNSAFFAAARP